MQFSPELGFWSPFIFWYCAINAIASVLFTLVVIVGGFYDLKYLFRALKEETIDETDDGRALPTSHDHPL
jgi:hypothetical protein